MYVNALLQDTVLDYSTFRLDHLGLLVANEKPWHNITLILSGKCRICVYITVESNWLITVNYNDTIVHVFRNCFINSILLQMHT